MVKRLVLFICVLCLSTICLASCIDSEKDEFSQMEAELRQLMEDIVFKTSFNVRYTQEADISLLTKRLKILCVEVVEMEIQDDFISYTVLSHFPFTHETADALMRKSGAQILDEDKSVVLSSEDVLDVKCDITCIDITMPMSFAEENHFGKMTLVIEEKEYVIWTSTEREYDSCNFSCILDMYEKNDAMIYAFAISMYPKDFVGEVDIEITQATQRVTDKMKN